MSIKIECYTVVTRIEAIKKKYPGGVKAFVKDYNGWRDEDLVGVDFMSIPDAEGFINTLVSKGFEYIARDTYSCADITIVDMFRGKLLRCEWIETGFDAATAKPICWLQKA